MAMMEIGIMRVAMHQPHMNMRMGMRLARAMMRVVNMTMLMLDPLMHMLVLVPLREMEVEAKRHQRAGGNQRHGHRLTEEENRHHRADEGRERVISSRARHAECAQRGDIDGEADAVAEKAEKR